MISTGADGWPQTIFPKGKTPVRFLCCSCVRRARKIKLGDAIIAATALETDSELVTRNEQDFRGIHGLRVINPFAGR